MTAKTGPINHDVRLGWISVRASAAAYQSQAYSHQEAPRRHEGAAGDMTVTINRQSTKQNDESLLSAPRWQTDLSELFKDSRKAGTQIGRNTECSSFSRFVSQPIETPIVGHSAGL
jgi:hypothetical protein